MIKSDNTKYTELRKTYPVFTFESFEYLIKNKRLEVKFHFHLDNKYHFSPKLRFLLPANSLSANLSDDFIKNSIFNIGMIEMLSYWKASCSPQIHIKPYKLADKQQSFWKKLYYNGLGEFFHTNNIIIQQEKLFEFTFENHATNTPSCSIIDIDNSYIIPIGGGKDSIVSIEILKKIEAKNKVLVVNQRGATRRVIEAAGYKEADIIEIERELDPLLLELNEKGFLNGHTPFSALLAFVCCFSAILSNTKNIALSNEASANEATVPGTNINHQYSKSFEFENDFRNYYSEFVSPSVNYFSLLRPFNELQIAAIFSELKKYFSVFKSCNAGSKTDIWCCNCSKCLFTYIILSPFLKEQEMEYIFGENLLNKESMATYFEQLAGFTEEKPFECVGTIDEVNAAIKETISKHQGELPFLLKLYKNKASKIAPTNTILYDYLSDYNEENFVNKNFEVILREEIAGIIKANNV